MKKILVLLDAIGIAISICLLLIYKDLQLFEVFLIFLMSMAYTIWPEKILRLGASLEWKASSDIEPTQFARITIKVVSVILTVGGYICCVYYTICLR